MRNLFLVVIVFAAFSILPAQVRAETETNFVITVKARDAKFIGTAAGGAQIVIRDRRTGDILASGVTYGETGDTSLLMADSRKRGEILTTEGSARFEFSLEFFEPIPVTVSATAPLAQGQSMVSVSEDMILIPGKDYASGNGIMLELPGFAVDVLSPAPNHKFPLNPDVPVTVEANVMKLCGCLVEENTPWPPARYEVEAHVYKDNLYITSFAMAYAGEAGIYSSNIKVPLAGTYRILVTAFDPQTKEAGMDATTIILEETKTDEKTTEKASEKPAP